MKILIAITSCAKNHERREAIQNTWLQAVPDHIDCAFFTGEEACGAINLNCGDDYENCAIKHIKILEYAKNYDFLFTCDDDTYVVIERLLKSNFEKFDYYGFIISGDEFDYAQGGAGYFLSRKAINIILSDSEKEIIAKELKFSDLFVGKIMNLNNISTKHNVYFHLGRYINDKGILGIYPTKYNRYITSHFCSPEQMYKIYNNNLPENSYKLYNEKLGEVISFYEKSGDWYFNVGQEERGSFLSTYEAENIFNYLINK